MSTANDSMLVEVARQAEAMRVANVNLAQAGNAESVPHAQKFLENFEGAGKSTAWCLALLQFDGVLDADELNAVAVGTKAAANAVAKSAVEKWLAKSLHRVATENEQRRRLTVAEASASPIPLSAAHSQLQTPQGAQALGALKLDLEGDVDNGSLRAFKHERQSSSGKEQAENESDEDESGKSARAIKLQREIVGANTLPLGKEQRQNFTKEVKLSTQTQRICNEFFKYVGPSRVQYRSVADQGDDELYLKAIPRPKISRSQSEEWQLGGHWNKPTKATQVGRDGAVEHSKQKEIDELWLKQRPLRDRIEKIDLPLAELSRQLADSLQAGPSASETWIMWQEELKDAPGDDDLGAEELVHKLTTQLRTKCVEISERACQSAFYSLLSDSVLQDKKFLLSQLHQESLMKGAYDVEKDYTGYEKKLNTGFDVTTLSEDAHVRRSFEIHAAGKSPRLSYDASPGGGGRGGRGRGRGFFGGGRNGGRGGGRSGGRGGGGGGGGGASSGEHFVPDQAHRGRGTGRGRGEGRGRGSPSGQSAVRGRGGQGRGH